MENLSIEIVKVAYDLYVKRGMAHGHDLEDWLAAEKIVLEKHAKEIEQEVNIIGAAKEKKASGKTRAKTVKTFEKTSKKTSINRSQTKPRKSPPKKRT